MNPCPICSDNREQDRGVEPFAIARLASGYVRLNPNQYFRGSCFFVAKACVREVYELDRTSRSLHLYEMSEVAQAVNDCFSPRKMNYESLGNGVPHLHWWITARYESDARS